MLMAPPDATFSSISAADLQDRQSRHAMRLRLLEIAAERGIELLDQIRDRAREGKDEENLGLTYARITKALRQSLMLHAKFEEDADKSLAQKEAEAAAAQAAEAQHAAQVEAGRKAVQKRHVKRAAKLAMDVAFDAAEARGEQSFDYAELYVDLNERLDDYDEYSDCGRLPVGAVVANICRVLGIAFDPALWEDEPWAAAEMAEKPEGSPFADWEPPETSGGDDDGVEDDAGEDREDDPYGVAEAADEPRRRGGAGPPRP